MRFYFPIFPISTMYVVKLVGVFVPPPFHDLYSRKSVPLLVPDNIIISSRVGFPELIII